jgi:hypothetical protein
MSAPIIDELRASISANTILNKADWDTIDNKHVVGNVRKTQAYKSFTDINNNPDDKSLLRDHQAELDSIITNQLSAPAHIIKRNPARIIYSTPTGSGKTFSSLLIAKMLQRSFQHTLLIYSVPTKEVLKRVGTDCEAHGIIYWTAGKIGNEYFIRRPYSCRTSKENAGQQRGDMFLQLLITIAQSIKYEDKIKGRPRVILADIEATAKLLEAIHENPAILSDIKIKTIDGKPVSSSSNTKHDDDDHHSSSSNKGKPSSDKSDFKLMDSLNTPETRAQMMTWLEPANIVLFFDEPNMGIHISDTVESTVKRIINNLPGTAILASATLKNWEALPGWWRGNITNPAIQPNYLTITCEPFNLPHAGLAVYSPATGTQKSQSVFDLFADHTNYSSHMSSINNIALGQLIRHFSEKQYIDISAGVKPVDSGKLASYRKTVIAPILTGLAQDTFINHRNKWSDYSGTKHSNMREMLSKTGITLIATLNPHKLARELTGLKTEEELADAYHEVRKQVRHAETKIKAQEREIAKAEKLKAKRDKPEDGDESATFRPIKCKFGALELYADELDGLSEESLVFLSRGIALSSPDADPGIKLQFQKAIYSRPEHVMVRPDIYILIVDYASIYGFDCPGVDKIILADDLGELLSHEDIIQFIGRLRRNGQSTFLSYNTMLKLVAPEHTVTPAHGLLQQDIMQFCTNYLNTPPKSYTAQYCLAQFKLICRRVYAGVTYEQTYIASHLLEYIIKNYLGQITRWLEPVNYIMNCIELDDPEFSQLLDNITPDLAQCAEDERIRDTLGMLFTNVSSELTLYINWYNPMISSNPELFARLIPIITWLVEMDKAESSEAESE